jgi:hypothetical protein
MGKIVKDFNEIKKKECPLLHLFSSGKFVTGIKRMKEGRGKNEMQFENPFCFCLIKLPVWELNRCPKDGLNNDKERVV